MKQLDVVDIEDSISERAIADGARTAEAGAIFVVVRGMILAHTFPVCVAKRRVAFNQDVKALVVDAGSDSRFFAHWLSGNADRMLGLVTEATHGTKKIDLPILQAQICPLPPLVEQRAIVAVLDTIDDAIRKTEQLIAKLQQVKQGLLHDLLTCGIDDNGELRDPERHPEQFQDSPLGRIPKVWEVPALEGVSVAPICYGIVQPGSFTPGGPFILTIGDLRGDFRTGLHQVAPSVELPYARSRTRCGDLLLSIKGTIGRIAVVPEWYVGNISRDVARIRLTPAAHPEFVRQFLMSPMGQRRLERAVVGTTRAEISIHVLKRFLVPLANITEQEEVARQLRAVDMRIESEEQTADKFRAVKSGLAEDLLTGRVRTTSLGEFTP